MPPDGWVTNGRCIFVNLCLSCRVIAASLLLSVYVEMEGEEEEEEEEVRRVCCCSRTKLGIALERVGGRQRERRGREWEM